MFLNRRHKPSSRIDTLVGAETVIEGSVTFGGGLRVDGCIRGDVRDAEGKAGTLVLSEHGRIEGAIHVAHAVINGTVIGPVNARDYVELQAKSRVTGDVRYRTLEIHMGALVEGRVLHLGDPAAAMPGKQETD